MGRLGLHVLQLPLDLFRQFGGICAGLFLNREDDGGRTVYPGVAALRERTAKAHVGDLAEGERRAIFALHRDDGIAQIVQAVHARQISNQPFGVGAEQKAAGRIHVRVLGRFLHVVERDVEVAQLKWVDQHLILLQLAADHADLRQTRDGEKPFADVPVGDRPQIHRRDFRIVARQADEHDFAHERANGREDRLRGRRQLFSHLLQPLRHDLPRDVDVLLETELDKNDAQANGGNGTHPLHAGGPVHRGFDRERNERFHFLRREPARFGENGDRRPV